ncbi:hypothetical protein D9K80_18445, partial [Acinetobacter cumulans]
TYTTLILLKYIENIKKSLQSRDFLEQLNSDSLHHAYQQNYLASPFITKDRLLKLVVIFILTFYEIALHDITKICE